MSIPEDVQNYINSLSVEISEINLNNKNITILPDLSRFKNLKTLYCHNNQLITIPVMKNLEILYCGYNKLTTIPLMNNLKYLYCHHNQLITIPLMNNLKTLDCHNNQLTTIPVMNNLKDLYCYNNKLTYIPVMNNLEILLCDNNHLTIIPIMMNLKILNCSNNQLTYIPVMNKLNDLICCNNQISYIPVMNLKILYCENNPIYDLIENSIDKLKILNKFKELFYMLKCKKRLRNFYYDKVIRPRIELKYHPDKLIELIEGQEDYESILESW